MILALVIEITVHKIVSLVINLCLEMYTVEFLQEYYQSA